jgi:ABC-type glycerol-3-phosphate transport system substrate-binding protein
MLLLGAALCLAAACGSSDHKESGGQAQPQATAAQGKDTVPTAAAATNPVDQVDIANEKVTLTFWHTQTGPNEAKLKSIIQSFQAKYPNITVDAQFQNSYSENYKKIKTAIVGGGLPDLSVAYPSEVSEYQVAEKVVALDDYINSQKYGFTKAELDDFVPVFLA